MTNKQIYRYDSISKFHKLCGLPPPEHPLISLVDYGKVEYQIVNQEISWIQNFYVIALKRNMKGKVRYGQQKYDFDEGLMSFGAPGQLVSVIMENQTDPKPSGWLLLVHPDFLWNTPLAKNIKDYDFFGYSVNEALFLSDKEENNIIGILQNIKNEYQSTIDKFSKKIIIAQLEVLLTYTERFYQRQFITREKTNHQILNRLEETLTQYFNRDDLIDKGLPTVQDIAASLNLSPNYLSGLLKTLTGQSTQQHIQDKVVEKAKEKLSTTDLSISEIAFELGFEHSQSFSRLFKSKTNFSPLEFRRSFN
ncbi:helix-turn-helix transcriptional regulator [candidate division KSB1 bacterium]|nr:helix-turn-helix transcriptional regulator [candidate division KSB1 bacterium]